MEYRYTYQDWQEDQISTKELDKLRSIGELSPEDYKRIRNEQEAIAKQTIEDRLEYDIKYFFKIYSRTFTKEAFLISYISELKNELDKFRARYPKIYQEILWGYDGRHDFSFYDIGYINYSNSRIEETIDQLQEDFEFYYDLKWALKNSRIRHIDHSYLEFDKLEIASALRLMQWLLWFQQRETKANAVIEEQFYKRALSKSKRNKSSKKSEISYFTWPQLFKDPKQADKVLKLIAEHLSSTGEWITFPKSRYLVALCMDLEIKGYFKNYNTITNPLKALAFGIQFGKISPKNFQPADRDLAEDFREHFKHIPYYQSETSS